MMLAGLPVPDNAIDGLTELVRAAGADDLADRLDRALADGVKLISTKGWLTSVASHRENADSNSTGGSVRAFRECGARSVCAFLPSTKGRGRCRQRTSVRIGASSACGAGM